MVHHIELRVHAGAPSRHTDDERHRAQALAYSRFPLADRIELCTAPPVKPTSQPDHHHAVSFTQSEDPDDGDLIQVEATGLSLDAGDEHGETTLLRPQDAMWVGDTQLAYTALESQIFTSSATRPDGSPDTRWRRQDVRDADEESEEWPEDLERQSPSKASFERRGVVLDERTADTAALKADAATTYEHDERNAEASRHPERLSPTLLRGHGKKRHLNEPPGFKPFKIPRPAAPKPAKESSHSQHTESAPSSSTRSSYLKTPVINRTGRKKARSDAASSQEVVQHVTPERKTASQSTTISSPNLIRSAESKSARLADYRERTPQHRRPAGPLPLPLPHYVPVSEGSRLGLAFIGRQDGIRDDKSAAGPAQQLPLAVSLSQGSHVGDGNETTSELPSSYGLGSTTTESSKGRPRASQRSVSDPGPTVESLRDGKEVAAVPASSQPVAPHHVDAVSPHQLRAAAKAIERNFSDNDGRPEPTSLEQQQPPSALPRSRPAPLPSSPLQAPVTFPMLQTPPPPPAPHLHLTVNAPAPPAALDTFTTHVTPSLHFLASSSGVKDSFRPVAVTREIRPLERGCWVLPSAGLAAWPEELWSEFWGFLEQFVGGGRAGWGVWCSRGGGADGDGEGETGDLMVYCWGEVVRHVWFLLYTASRSKVRRMGCWWVDGGGEVVVRMREK